MCGFWETREYCAINTKEISASEISRTYLLLLICFDPAYTATIIWQMTVEPTCFYLSFIDKEREYLRCNPCLNKMLFTAIMHATILERESSKRDMPLVAYPPCGLERTESPPKLYDAPYRTFSSSSEHWSFPSVWISFYSFRTRVATRPEADMK